MSRKHIPTIKVCILGETGVGKTCLSNKLVKDDEYNHNYLEQPTKITWLECNKTFQLW